MNAIFNQEDIFCFNEEKINVLRERAEAATLKRFRYCLHKDHREVVQEMVIGILKGSYVRPHRHPIEKRESYHIISGQIDVILFEDDGTIKNIIHLDGDKKKTILYHLSSNIWHMPLVRSDFAVYHEVLTGPFNKEEDVEYADWSPDPEKKEDVKNYLNRFISI